ncbi:MAG: hypothetical protein GY936_14300 [Ignavibacteriae bacterium]|nr:hypothetical protein [Ignavibacteriota bacterium]
MEIVEQSQLVETSDMIQIYDAEKKITWFINVVRVDGKFQKIKEALNPKLLEEQGGDYIQRLYELAYNAVK